MNIRLLVLFPVLLLSIHSIILGQNSDQDIARIKQIFKGVNSDTHLKKLVVEGEDFLEQTTDGGASLTGYFSKEELVKISEWIGLSFGIRQRVFYFDSTQVIFCFVMEQHFKITDTGLNYNKTELVFQGRYYYKSNTLIQKKLTGSGFWDKKDEATNLRDSEKYFKILNIKRANVK
jgi:hypothetical protein